MEQNEALVRQEAMPEQNQNQEENAVEKPQDMETLLQEEGLGLDFPKEGEIRSGTVASIGPNEILVSIGTKSEGIISGREKELIPPDELKQLEVGQEIPVYVINPEDQNGNVVLSYVRAREERDWQDVEDLQHSSETYQGKIIGYNKGGLIVPIGSLRGFVPASQVSILRRVDSGAESPEQRWGKMVGDPITVRVIEVDRERRRLILSERAALQETRETLKDRLLEELEEGTIRNGRVTSLADFGAFVNIDGADGLVHLSEITWDRIQHPSEVLKVGQEVKVKVISMDRERKRIGLSIRQLLPDPWTKKVEGIREGQLLEGTITHLTKFGAFARIGEELEGLIHVSELSEQRVAHPKEVVKEGDMVTMRVIKIDPERRRIGLSLRKVDSPAYADLDWKMALAEEIGEVQEDEDVPAEEIESAPEATQEDVAEVVGELEAVDTAAIEPEAGEEFDPETDLDTESEPEAAEVTEPEPEAAEVTEPEPEAADVTKPEPEAALDPESEPEAALDTEPESEAAEDTEPEPEAAEDIETEAGEEEQKEE
jgi:small subunit ribosomal protein S1